MSYPTRVRYGLRLLVRLAMQSSDQYVSMSEIAQEEGVSSKYLEQIVSLLKPMGILQAVRGAHGGYSLLRDAEEIFMDQVFDSLGALSFPVPCIGDSSFCERADLCTTRPFWADLDSCLRAYLSGVSLADIVAAAPQGGAEFLLQKSAAIACGRRR